MATKRPCPVCGKHMTQQFIGLYHCRCGISQCNGKYFVRTKDMVFRLKKVKIGKKMRYRPEVIGGEEFEPDTIKRCQ